MTYTNPTRLWSKSLGRKASASSRLAEALTRFRDQAAILAAEIARQFPEFTVHDVTHLDALWELADLIAGPGVDLTPSEAFVLGGAFLVHDLGMATAALPYGTEQIKNDPLWEDIFVSKLKSVQQESANEFIEKNLEIEALSEYLRLRHAERASHIPAAEYRIDSSGGPFYLIEDVDLRSTFGEVIGALAYSHWFSVEEVRRHFAGLPALGAPAFLNCPSTWTIDRLKLACLLRAADAAHLDARRAPGFLRALRRPAVCSDQHWIFQGALNRVQRVEDRLVFTSGRAFTVQEHEAWWTGFDLLSSCDYELRKIDSMLQDIGTSYRFAARSVAGVEAPERLSKYIPTKGWEPIEASVRVNNVAALVSRLGGEGLYGHDQTVPIRELIQNASDAIKARRLIEDRDAQWGDVTVELGTNSEGDFVQISDTGVGMSQAVLTGPLLDFGGSLWSTARMRYEFPGLAAKRFEPTGTFGIGFFSVLMLGEHIKVTTRRYDAAIGETRVLEFRTGLQQRPLLRFASEKESLPEGGTRVQVWCRKPFGDILNQLGRQRSLAEFCAWLCPTSDVNIFAKDNQKSVVAVRASDWQDLPAMELLTRISSPIFSQPRVLTKLASRVTEIREGDGTLVGRAGITLEEEERVLEKPGKFRSTTFQCESIVTVGGLRSMSAGGHAFGVFLGSTSLASRNWATALGSDDAFARWASTQAELIATLAKSPQEVESAAAYIRMCGGNTGKLPIVRIREGWLSTADILELENCPDEILLCEGSSSSGRSHVFDDDEAEDDADLELNDAVWLISSLRTMAFPLDMHEINRPREMPVRTSQEEEALGWWYFNEPTLAGAAVEALANRWRTTVLDIQKCSIIPVEWNFPERIIGVKGGQPALRGVRILRRPRPLDE